MNAEAGDAPLEFSKFRDPSLHDFEIRQVSCSFERVSLQLELEERKKLRMDLFGVHAIAFCVEHPKNVIFDCFYTEIDQSNLNAVKSRFRYIFSGEEIIGKLFVAMDFSTPSEFGCICDRLEVRE
ncbi:hypothetical protein AAFN47_01715 [Hoeflea sp. CAU 1731]